MRKLTPPLSDQNPKKVVEMATDIFVGCSKKIKNPERRKKILALKAAIGSSYATYITLAKQAQLHTLSSPGSSELQEQNCEIIQNLYRDHFSRNDSTSRDRYNELLQIPKNRECPLCGQRLATTLDHYLPQKKFAAFAVFLFNLVPACAVCNRLKGEFSPGHQQEQLIHPYFDDFDSEQWLFAEILKDQGEPIVLFKPKPPISWPELKRERIDFHFKRLELGALYSANAASCICHIRGYLRKLKAAEGREALREYLLDQSESRRLIHKNGWELATYEALANSDWFLETGL